VKLWREVPGLSEVLDELKYSGIFSSNKIVYKTMFIIRFSGGMEIIK